MLQILISFEVVATGVCFDPMGSLGTGQLETNRHDKQNDILQLI